MNLLQARAERQRTGEPGDDGHARVTALVPVPILRRQHGSPHQPRADRDHAGYHVRVRRAHQDGGPAVFVNVWDRISVERWIFTAAHELAHLLLHPHAYDVSKTQEAEAEETEADAFAGHFIMPDHLFEAEWEQARGLDLVDRVFKVKRIFRVSWQTVVYRVAADLPKGQRSKLWQQFNFAYKKRYGQPLTRRSEPEALDPKDFGGRPADRVADEPARCIDDDFQEDRLSRLVREAVETEKISLGRAAEILGVDLPRMRDLAGSWFG